MRNSYRILPRTFRAGSAVLALLLVAAPSFALGSRRSKDVAPPSGRRAELVRVRDEAVKAANEYKATLEQLRAAYLREVGQAEARVKQLEALVGEGLVARREVDEAQSALKQAKLKVDQVASQMAGVDVTLEEISAFEAQQNAVVAPSGARGAALRIRGLGMGGWSIANAGRVESFFASRFGHTLPISAFGQTALHTKLGYDHHNAMDVPVHPDSAEGQILIGYLRASGIPFLAFRGAIPGVATGPHIHIGNPSHRF